MGRQNKMTQETAAELQPGGALTRAELHRLVAFAGLADMWCSRTSRLVSHSYTSSRSLSAPGPLAVSCAPLRPGTWC